MAERPAKISLKRRALLAAVLVAPSGFAATGCQSKAQSHGEQRQTSATYAFGSLSAELPSDTPVITVAAAAESTLRRRGYVVTRKHAASDRARIDGEIGGEGASGFGGGRMSTSVQVWVAKNATAVSVTVSPWGDEEASRAILDGVLAKLGL